VDDQALYLVTGSGVIVLLGCAHAGVINTLDHIANLTGNAPLLAVIGGMHLRTASKERIAWTIEQLRRLGPELFVPAHCTGSTATTALMEAFGVQCRAGEVGYQVELPNRSS
jgi:7,8-dihydropterin-6-yl-methyl-4-(beta-D-ribofuranosyl)aminobenzene 5'-phosphate synthase